MLPKVVFDKAAFVKFQISNNFKQNIDEINSKPANIYRKIHTSVWILKISSRWIRGIVTVICMFCCQD